ncbi:MAG: helix-turn-helix domain-containing protein [Aquihabitans sp.]
MGLLLQRLRRDSDETKEDIRYCPVSMGSEIIADPWTPMILRELVLGNTRFNEIARGLPGISRSLLVRRLSHLERTGVIERWPARTGTGSEYRLTPAGQDLEGVLMALGRWSVNWLYDELRPRDLDPVTLMWWMHRRVVADAIPSDRVTVEFNFTAPTPTTIWLVLSPSEVSVCTNYPGFDADVVVRCPTPVLSAVFNGLEDWHDQIALGLIEVSGPPRLIRALPRCFSWSPFAPDIRAAEAQFTSG